MVTTKIFQQQKLFMYVEKMEEYERDLHLSPSSDTTDPSNQCQISSQAELVYCASAWEELLHLHPIYHSSSIVLCKITQP